jgi:tripartite-type tricarboxylate transporter receptor subunit TctC
MRKLLCGIAALVLGGAAGAQGQTFPSRPVTIVVPFSAGGPTDTLARILVERLKGPLGQNLIIENTTGAAGTLGTARVARAPADGYTLILGHWQTHVVNGATFGSLPFDVVKDFEPISLVADCPVWFVGRASLASNDLKELIVWLKANNGKATVGIAGVGGGGDVVGSYFKKNTGTEFQFVPYRGAAPLVQDLVAGQIDLTFGQVAGHLAQFRAGQLKAYMVMAATRWPAAPDTPTIDEAGLPGLYASFWHGLWAPSGTSKDVIARLNAALVDALADPAVQRRFADVGQGTWPRDKQTPEALAVHQKAEVEKWWPIIKTAGIKAE